jgi:hypothetical protein
MNFVNKCLACILFILAILPMQGCARDYSAKSIEAWVVDAETGKPLEGVNVVARWELRYGLEGGGAYQLQVMETVTDKDGRLFFPAWGPKEIPGHLPSEARLKDADPEIAFFKGGYKALVLRNERLISSMGGHGASIRSSDWNGKTIQLHKFLGSLQEYVFNLEYAQSGLGFITLGENCEWKLVPKMILTLTKEAKLLKEQNIETHLLEFRSIDDLPNQAWCGSAKAFFEAYK